MQSSGVSHKVLHFGETSITLPHFEGHSGVGEVFSGNGEDDDFDDITGLLIWPASKLLCSYIVENKHLFNGKRVLELGAGTGICSLTAAKFSDEVVATDGNVRVIRDLPFRFSVNATVARVSAQRLLWGDVQEVKGILEPESDRGQSSFDIILASDVLYPGQPDSLPSSFFATARALLLGDVTSLSVSPCSGSGGGVGQPETMVSVSPCSGSGGGVGQPETMVSVPPATASGGDGAAQSETMMVSVSPSTPVAGGVETNTEVAVSESGSGKAAGGVVALAVASGGGSPNKEASALVDICRVTPAVGSRLTTAGSPPPLPTNEALVHVVGGCGGGPPNPSSAVSPGGNTSRDSETDHMLTTFGGGGVGASEGNSSTLAGKSTLCCPATSRLCMEAPDVVVAHNSAPCSSSSRSTPEPRAVTLRTQASSNPDNTTTADGAVAATTRGGDPTTGVPRTAHVASAHTPVAAAPPTTATETHPPPPPPQRLLLLSFVIRTMKRLPQRLLLAAHQHGFTVRRVYLQSDSNGLETPRLALLALTLPPPRGDGGRDTISCCDDNSVSSSTTTATFSSLCERLGWHTVFPTVLTKKQLMVVGMMGGGGEEEEARLVVRSSGGRRGEEQQQQQQQQQGVRTTIRTQNMEEDDDDSSSDLWGSVCSSPREDI